MVESKRQWKHIYVIIPWMVVCLMLCSLHAAQSNTTSLVELGRSNPFANIDRPQVLVQSNVVSGPNEPNVAIPDLFIETITLKFMDAGSLQQGLTNMLSTYGSIMVNAKTNSLIICDTKEKIEWITSEIRKADKTPQQIVIETVIIDVQLTDDKEIGINWDIMSDKNYDIGYRQNLTSRLGSTIENATTTGNASAFVTTGTGGDFSLISGTIRNVVHLIQQKRDVDILASPKVMVLSGQTASIEAVEEIPYRELTETSMGGELASVSFKQVGLKMSVTATLTDSNEILVQVEPEQNINTAVFGIDNIPIIDTRKAQTTLLLNDGQVVVIGGLRRKERSKVRDQIPVVGDLPVVGSLFGRDKIVTTNSELIVLLCPHVDKGKSVSTAAKAKYDAITSDSIVKKKYEEEAKKKKNEDNKRDR